MSWSQRFRTAKSEKKRRDPQKLADVLPQLMARRGYNRLISQDNYSQAWQTVAGPLYQHSRTGALRSGVLEIVVANSLALQELTFQKRQLLAQLIQQLPDQKINDLRFVVGVID